MNKIKHTSNLDVSVAIYSDHFVNFFAMKLTTKAIILTINLIRKIVLLV